jgi:hypothetical protein
MSNQEMVVKFLKGAAIAAATGLLAWGSTVLIPSLEANGTSAIVIALLGSAINGAKLIVEKLKARE